MSLGRERHLLPSGQPPRARDGDLVLIAPAASTSSTPPLDPTFPVIVRSPRRSGAATSLSCPPREAVRCARPASRRLSPSACVERLAEGWWSSGPCSTDRGGAPRRRVVKRFSMTDLALLGLACTTSALTPRYTRCPPARAGQGDHHRAGLYLAADDDRAPRAARHRHSIKATSWSPRRPTSLPPRSPVGGRRGARCREADDTRRAPYNDAGGHEASGIRAIKVMSQLRTDGDVGPAS